MISLIGEVIVGGPLRALGDDALERTNPVEGNILSSRTDNRFSIRIL